jgi:hypothetical protein
MAQNSVLLFTAPISRPALYGGGQLSGVKINRYFVDPDTLVGTVIGAFIETPLDQRTFSVGPFTGATTLAQQLGVTFQ